MYKYPVFSNFENSITESKNVLIFSLNLDYPSSSSYSVKRTSIDAAWQFTFDNCAKILNNGDVNFFGRYLPNASPYSESSLVQMASPSSYQIIWKNLLKHHCIMAAFDKLHNMIFSTVQLTPYGLVRGFTDIGFHYALAHEHFKVAASENHFVFNDGLQKSHYGVIKSEQTASPTSAAARRLQILSRALPSELMMLKPIPEIFKQVATNKSIPGNYAVLYHILNKRRTNFKSLFKLYSVENFSISSRKIKENIAFINTVVEEPSMPVKRTGPHPEPINRVDYLFYRYRLEQLFNFDLIYCLTKNISRLEHHLNQKLSDSIPFIDFITCSVNLPNVFSRHIFIQMAFDSFKAEQELNSSCLLDRLKSPDVIAKFKDSSIKLTDSHIRLSQWQKRYTDFINYMAKIVFPVYENYFFLQLYDLCLPLHSKETAADDMVKLYFLLMDYLSYKNVYSEFLEPEIIIENAWNQSSNSEQKRKILSNIITPDYQIDENLDTALFRRLTLSAYNHSPEPIPAFLDRDYFRAFDNLPERFIDLCTAYAIKE